MLCRQRRCAFRSSFPSSPVGCSRDDLAGFHLPFRYLYREALRAGDSFVWSPAFYSGYYLHGEGQAGMAHPFHLLLYRFLPLGPAFNLEIITSYAVAFAGTGRLLRRLGLSTEASWFGAMVFAFSGFNLLHLMQVNVVAVVAHAPWMLLAAHVLLTSTDPRARAWAFASLSLLLGSQLLLGFPQCAVMTCLAVAFLATCLVLGGAGPARVLLLFGALGMGVLVSGVQFLPSLDVLRASWRGKLWPEFRLWFSLPPWNLVQLWSPFAFRSRIYADSGEFVPHELSVYNGAFCTVALAWLAVRWHELARRPLAAALLAFASVALVFALGRHAGVYVWLARLPGLNGFRAPARHIVLLHLALSGIAAIVFEDLVGVVRRGERIALRRLWPLAIPVVLSLVTTAVAAGLAWSSWAPANGSGLSGLAVAGPWSCMMLLVAGLVALTGRGKHWCVPALVVVTALDLGLWGYSYVYQNGPPETIEALTARAQLPPGAVPGDLFQPRGEGTPANVSVLRGLRLTWGYVTLDPTSVLDVTDPVVQRIAGVAWRLDGPGWLRALDPMPRARLVSSAEESRDIGADIHGIDISRVALVDAPLHASDRRQRRAQAEVAWRVLGFTQLRNRARPSRGNNISHPVNVAGPCLLFRRNRVQSPRGHRPR